MNMNNNRIKNDIDASNEFKNCSKQYNFSMIKHCNQKGKDIRIN